MCPTSSGVHQRVGVEREHADAVRGGLVRISCGVSCIGGGSGEGGRSDALELFERVARGHSLDHAEPRAAPLTKEMMPRAKQSSPSPMRAERWPIAAAATPSLSR